MTTSGRYLDHDNFERERRLIFSRTWQFFGLASDYVRPGDYVAADIAGAPVVVVRDRTGALHGFHNVCPHRAGPLVGGDRGRCDKAIVCKVHGWRFDFAGGLLDAPGYEQVAGFSAADYGLYPIRVETWREFVFVNLDLAAQPLSDRLNPIDDRMTSPIARPARLQHCHPVDCNWKIYVENFLSTRAATIPEKRSPVGDVLFSAPPTAADGVDSAWVFVWPNLVFSLYRGVLLIEHLQPTEVGRTGVNHVFLHAPEDPTVDAAIVASEAETEKSAEVCEHVQRALRSGTFHVGAAVRAHEAAVEWFNARTGAAMEAFHPQDPGR